MLLQCLSLLYNNFDVLRRGDTKHFVQPLTMIMNQLLTTIRANSVTALIKQTFNYYSP